MAFKIGMSVPGSELLGGYGGDLLRQQQEDESDNERKKRLAAMQQQRLLPGASPAGRALGLTTTGGLGAVSGGMGGGFSAAGGLRGY